MKAVLRHILTATALVLFATGMAVLVGLSREERRQLTCTGLQVRVTDPFVFVTEDDVKGYLNRYYGPYIGQRLDSVRLFSIENILNRQSAVLRSEAWTDLEGILHVDISQREPVMRIQNGERGFYIDGRGSIFPLQKSYTSLVPVVDGAVPFSIPDGYKGDAPDELSRQWVSDMLSLVSYMKKSRVWDENISQISVLDGGDLMLVPREGRERFIIGGCDCLDEKFERISDYYKFVKPSAEEGLYKTVNVKYHGQIICRKQ